MTMRTMWQVGRVGVAVRLAGCLALAGHSSAQTTNGTAGSSGQLLFGVNWAGAEFAGSRLPGQEGRDFGWPTAESLDYWRSKNVRLIRLPFSWERLQPALMGEFAPDYFAGLKRAVGLMRERDMVVVLDMHNYARYRGQLIGSEQVPVAAFADAWQRLAQAFKDDAAIWGYGLMNEPDRKVWPPAAQAAVDAIRTVDRKTLIVVANDYAGWEAAPARIQKYGGAAAASGDLAAWAAERMPFGDPAALRDPATNLCFELHAYFDHDNSGTYRKSYEEELARRDGPEVRVSPTVGVERIRPFVAWLQRHGVRGFVGEYGVPANPDVDVRWLEALENAVVYLRTNNLTSTYWAAGSRWTPGNASVIEPTGWPTTLGAVERQQDRPQLKVLQKYMPDRAAGTNREYGSSERFEKEILAFEAADLKQPPPTGAIVCLGSSSMKGWNAKLAEDLAPLTVIPRGFGGSNMNDALHFFDRIVTPCKPRAIVVYEGDNDIAFGIAPERLRDAFRALVDKAHRECPGARIYVLSIKPSISRWRIWPKMVAANRLIEQVCAGDKLLCYVDVATPMLDANGEPRKDIFKPDKLHMTREGYVIWRDVLKPVLLKNELAFEKQ